MGGEIQSLDIFTSRWFPSGWISVPDIIDEMILGPQCSVEETDEYLVGVKEATHSKCID